MKTGKTVLDILQEKHTDMNLPPVENPIYAAFEEYKEVLETVPLDLSEDDVTCVASNILGAAGALGEEAIDLRN